MSENNVTVRARVNEDLRKEATVVLKSIGLTMSDVICMLLTRIAANKALPFGLIPNAETLEAIKESRSGNLKSFATVGECMTEPDDELSKTYSMAALNIDSGDLEIFDCTAKPNETTMQAMVDMENGDCDSFDSVEALMADLNDEPTEKD